MIKRPLAVLGLIYLGFSAVAVCFVSDINFTVAFMAALIGCAACFFVPEKCREIIIITIPVFLAFFVIGIHQVRQESLSAELGANTCQLSGVVCEMPRRQYGRWYYVLRTDRIGIKGAHQQVRIRLTCRNSLEAQEGDRITCTATFVRNHNETGYDSETALLADGISARAWCSPYTEATVTAGHGGISFFHIRLRRFIISAIRKALPEQSSAMLCAMLLGDTDYLSSETLEHFRTTGLAHLLAVSGLHVSLLTYAISRLLHKLRLSVRANIVATMCFLLLFMAVTGFSPSVTRAGIMHLMALFSRLTFRDTDGLTSLSLSVLFICAVNPWNAADIGLQLSVCATLGLILMAHKTQKAVRRRFALTDKRDMLSRCKVYIADTLVTSFTAAIFTLPLNAIYFGRISLIAPLTNLLCAYAASLFIVLGLLAALLYSLPLAGYVLSFPLRLAATLLCGYLHLCTGCFAKFPFAAIHLSYPYIPLFFGFAAAILLLNGLYARRGTSSALHRRAVLCVFSGVSALLLIAMGSFQASCTGPAITVFSLQDGGICVCARNGTHALMAEAGGDSYDLFTVEDTLSACGVQTLDAIVVSAPTDSRSHNAEGIIAAYAPASCLCGGSVSHYPSAGKAAAKSHTAIEPFGGHVSLDALHLSVRMYTDAAGNRWEQLQCGDAAVLICPDDGDCALLPEDFLTNDVTVTGGNVKNIFRLRTGAIILTAPFEEAAQTACRLYVKGFRHIYLTQRDGTVTFTVRNGKLYLQCGQ